MPRVAVLRSALTRATCSRLACGRFGRNPTSPSIIMNGSTRTAVFAHSCAISVPLYVSMTDRLQTRRRGLVLVFRASAVGVRGARRGGVSGPFGQQQDQRHQRRRAGGDRLSNRLCGPPGADHQAGQQQRQCQTQGPLVSFRVHPLFPRCQVMLRQRRQGLPVNGREALPLRPAFVRLATTPGSDTGEPGSSRRRDLRRRASARAV